MKNVINKAFEAMNILSIHTIMKKSVKYLCAVLLLIGTSASAWGAINIDYGGNYYYNGDIITINVELEDDIVAGADAMTIKNDGTGWSSSTWYRGYIHATISGTYVYSNIAFGMAGVEGKNGTPYWSDDDHYTSFYEWNNWQYETISFYTSYAFDAVGTYNSTITIVQKDDNDASTLQSATITVRYVVTATCTQPTVAFSSNTTLYKAIDAPNFTRTATATVNEVSTEQTINYTSSNTSIATVNSSGEVTIKGVVGNTTITATAEANSTYCEGTDSYQIYVYTNPVVNATNFAGVSLTPTEASFKGGQISNKGGLDIVSYGYVIGTTSSVDWSTKVAAAGANGDPGLNTDYGTLTTTTALTPGTQYYLRVFAYNGKAFGYSTYGSFKTPYAITLNKNNSDLSGSTSGSAYILPDGTSFRSGFTPPTREHYTVEGYYTTSDCTVKIATDEGALQANVEVSSTTWTNGSSQWKRGAGETFYAKWIPVNYTISFNSNGGSGSMSSVEKAYNSSYSLPSCTFTPPSGKVFDHWGAGSAGGTSYDVDDSYTVTGDITFYAVWKDGTPTDFVFSCAELTLTPHLVTASTPIFITSAASKTVRSQDYIQITGSGLTPSTTLTFPGLNSKFEIKTATYGTLATDENGAIDVAAYIFYTPGEDETTDGLLKITGLTVAVDGAKPKTVTLTQDIIGRHLPANFVIAGKKDGKWYALPATMESTDHPTPAEIAVDNATNPAIAYTEESNKYGLVGPTATVSGNIKSGVGQYVKLTMHPLSDAPLFGQAPSNTGIGKSGTAIATNDLSEGYWWQLKQTNTSITNPQDAKYTIYCANNTSSLSIKDNAGNPEWGLYASGVEELRLIPASDIIYTEAYFVEWGQHGGVVEVDAQGISATSVIAHLGEESSSAITLVQTGTSVKGSATKYNYTVNFGEGIDFAATASNGALLTLEWKNGETVKAVSNIVVPKIIATSATMSSINSGDDPWLQMEVHVLPGVTLTANAGDFSSNDVVINQLEIYPGATVEVTKGAAASGTLKVKTLVLRNGWTRAGEKAYDVARLYITPSTASLDKNAVSDVWYSDWYIDYDQYYPVAVPWKVTLATGLQYRYTKVSPTYGYDKNIRLLYYDGEGRVKGTNGSAGDGANWRFYGAPGGKAMPATLDPSKAYAMTAKRPTGKAFSIIRMTMEVPSADWTTSGEQGHVTVGAVTTYKDTVNVVAYNNDQGNAAEYAKGWNFIANPYMSLYQGPIGYTEGDETVKYVNIPDEKFKEYDQQLTLTAKLKPASGVLIQAPKTGRLIFGTANRKLSMPSFYSETQKEQIPEQQVVVVLSDETNEDMMGLLVSDKYTAEYEINADLEKLLSDGNTLRTYMRYGDMNMAYVAINETLAKEWIPVSVRIPADGEYTFSLHEASIAGELEGVYLIDYQNGDKITNLIEQSYTFSSTAGTINGRFAINAKVGERQTPTGIDAINAGGDINSDKPFKFIYHDKVYIWLNGVIYDTTGKRVK